MFTKREAQITGLIIFTTCVFTVGRNIIGGLPWVVFPLIPDIDMIIHKEQRAGVFAGAMTFVRKFTNIVFNVVIGLKVKAFHKAISIKPPTKNVISIAIPKPAL